jgi:hypothetical protein
MGRPATGKLRGGLTVKFVAAEGPLPLKFDELLV